MAGDGGGGTGGGGGGGRVVKEYRGKKGGVWMKRGLNGGMSEEMGVKGRRVEAGVQEGERTSERAIDIRI